MKTNRPQPTPIDRKEWDFSAIPENEILNACLWEYARTSNYARPRIKALLDRSASGINVVSWNGNIWINAFGNSRSVRKPLHWKDPWHFEANIRLARLLEAYGDVFPNPWRDITKKKKGKKGLAMGDLADTLESIRANDLSEPEPLRTKSAQNKWLNAQNGRLLDFETYCKYYKVQFFSVDWHITDSVDEILKELNLFLVSDRKQWREGRDSSIKRGINALTALAVLRFQNSHFSFDQAQVDLEKHGVDLKNINVGLPIYSDPTAWSRAKKMAQNHLEKLESHWKLNFLETVNLEQINSS